MSIPIVITPTESGDQPLAPLGTCVLYTDGFTYMSVVSASTTAPAANDLCTLTSATAFTVVTHAATAEDYQGNILGQFVSSPALGDYCWVKLRQTGLITTMNTGTGGSTTANLPVETQNKAGKITKCATADYTSGKALGVALSAVTANVSVLVRWN